MTINKKAYPRRLLDSFIKQCSTFTGSFNLIIIGRYTPRLSSEASLEIYDYTHTPLGNSTVEGRKAYKVESIPKGDPTVVSGKVIMFVSKKDALQLLTRFYDEKMNMIHPLQGTT